MFRRLIVLAALLSFAVPCVGSPKAPTGWFLAGSRPEDYSVGTDRQEHEAGRASAYLRSIVPFAEGFGTLMQETLADAYRGKRLRLTAQVKTDDVQGWAGVWMRIDGVSRVIVLDNMHDRPIMGNTEWQEYAVVLDVPSAASGIAYGVLLQGPGRVWMDELSLEVVDASVPVTAESNNKGTAPEGTAPINLDFEG